MSDISKGLWCAGCAEFVTPKRLDPQVGGAGYAHVVQVDGRSVVCGDVTLEAYADGYAMREAHEAAKGSR